MADVNEAGLPRSPLSSTAPEKVRTLPRTFILEQLERYFGTRPPAESLECDYELWRCAETDLEFAWPLRAGNDVFYQWLAGFKTYYPAHRWEYTAVRRLIEGSSTARVLDVGCGRGDFLRSLNGVSTEKKFALDMNEPAIADCRRHGL